MDDSYKVYKVTLVFMSAEIIIVMRGNYNYVKEAAIQYATNVGAVFICQEEAEDEHT